MINILNMSKITYINIYNKLCLFKLINKNGRI